MVVPASFFCNGNNVIMTKLDRAASQLCKYKFVKAIHNVSCAPHDIVVDPPIFSDHHLTSCKFMIVRPTPRAQQFKVVSRLNSIDSDSLVDAIRRLSLLIKLYIW